MALVEATEFFHAHELPIAREVLEDSVRKVPSDYTSIVATAGDEIVGWAAYGPTACTEGTWDLYWIAVDPRAQRRKVGSCLMAAAEEAIRREAGRLIMVETSGRPLYVPTRRFYLHQGYVALACIPEFYGPGDDQVLLGKYLQRMEARP